MNSHRSKSGRSGAGRGRGFLAVAEALAVACGEERVFTATFTLRPSLMVVRKAHKLMKDPAAGEVPAACLPDRGKVLHYHQCAAFFKEKKGKLHKAAANRKSKHGRIV